MSDPIRFYTKTMAGVYAAQGYFDKAIEIYRHLLEKEPEREDLQEALADAEAKQRQAAGIGYTDLIPLLREWIMLSIRYNQVRRLKRLGGKG